MHFYLHLSSASLSQVSSGQYNKVPRLRKHEMNKCLSQKSVSKNPTITHGVACVYSSEDPAARLDKSPVVFKKNLPCEPITGQPINKTNHSIELECHGKFDGRGLKSTVADDVIEPSIAASEAVVISEMMFSSMQFEYFSDAAIIEIALRVKLARNECMLEASHSFSVADPDDIDQLSDLDEDSMSDAFEDVGITVQQSAENSGCPFACRKSSNSSQVSDTKQQWILKSDSSFADNVLAGSLGNERNVLPVNIKGVYMSKSSSQICSPLNCNLQSNSMCEEVRPQMQTKSSGNLPLDYSVQSLIYHAPEKEQKIRIKDDFPANQMCSLEHHCIQKVGRVSQSSNAMVKKSLKLLNWETSFLSESMDFSDQDVSQIKPSVDLTIVSSSETAMQVPFSGFCKEKKHNHEAPLSQDYSRSLSLSDPLCSVVPCSISSGFSVGCKTKLATDGVKNPKNPVIVIYSKCLDGNPTMQNNAMLQKPFLESRELILSEAKFEQPDVPHRMQLTSLGPYDLATYSHEKAEGSNSPGKSNNEQILEQNKNGVLSLAIRGTDNDDTQTHVLEDAFSSPILESCKVTICGNGHESMKISSASALGKYRSDDSTKKANYRRESISKSHIPSQSNLHSFPEDKRPTNKRVRFQEAAYNTGSCSGTTAPYKSESMDHKYNYLTSNRSERNNRMILQGLEFLLTGFSSCKAKYLEELIRRNGGYVLPNIPSNSPYLSGNSIKPANAKLPVILCPKKVQTTKFLYGCAVNTFMLNDHWLEDSIQACTRLPPGRYMTRHIPGSRESKLIMMESFRSNNGTPIFHKVGMMVHGKVKFCTKFMKIVKHGGGQVFKSLKRLVQSLKNGTNTLGVLLVKNESSVSRHLKHCALEHNIPTMPASWIINSLFCGKLLSSKRDRCASLHWVEIPSLPKPQVYVDMSQEI